MEHAARQTFDADDLEAFHTEAEVDVETWNAVRGLRRVTIWVVVVDETPYVRSFRGPRGHWYRDLEGEPHGALRVQDRRVPFRAEPEDDSRILEAVSRELARKYRDDPSMPAMLTPNVVDTTLRLRPA